MSQRWGHTDVHLLMATREAQYIGAYAEVQRGCRTELFRSMGRGAWWRVEETVEDVRATDLTELLEAEPKSFAQDDPEAMPSLRHGLEQVELARRIATQAHAGQTDRAGRPYIDHPRRVASRLTGLQAQAVAWLHDVLEDTATTVDRLRDEGVDDDVIAAVRLLTRVDDDTAYYARIAADPLAREVKLADIADNTDPERTALVDAATRTRLATKYDHARRALGAQEEDA